jgi:hypothetical protein
MFSRHFSFWQLPIIVLLLVKHQNAEGCPHYANGLERGIDLPRMRREGNNGVFPYGESKRRG